MINFFFNIINKKNKKINPVIRELIDFTKLQDPESFKIMDLLPELRKIKPSKDDLDILEETFINRNNWTTLNKDYWEEIIANILKENGRDIQ